MKHSDSKFIFATKTNFSHDIVWIRMNMFIVSLTVQGEKSNIFQLKFHATKNDRMVTFGNDIRSVQVSFII